MATKKAVREQVMAALNAMPDDVRHFQAGTLYERLFESEEWNRSQTVAVTLSTGFELDTQPIIDAAKQAHKEIVVPKTFSTDRKMVFLPLTDATVLKESKFGIMEPENGIEVTKKQIDLIVVPGLGFTKKGVRLGFGGGYYDRFLADYQGRTVTLAFEPQMFKEPTWQVADTDVLIQHVITSY
ncbi:5-formyltetrahydrofolate cyclo-ligase [Secundilactobacillus pentosiphilus]|uniref:5-formyltetrahydrofolate cyclo-ligase n=1 Tax=Secundilactobacillus pentosiphilus TaxID=1714682 RepID=A0A1Z5IM33_9LACO|nr:5-formyltetrahydrofolate cyclo-ligase [Secundilactobacillus pentosiphilus]GAX02698.1 5-formyltetrahydrofolate cyclo-ligase [Secundilactobacillus pentosiphilus]